MVGHSRDCHDNKFTSNSLQGVSQTPKLLFTLHLEHVSDWIHWVDA